MTVETVLAYALGLIGVLLTMLIGLVVYVFLSLKSEVKNVADEVSDLNRARIKLVHRDDCRIVTDRMQDKLDEHEAQLHELNERIIRVEATQDIEHC